MAFPKAGDRCGAAGEDGATGTVNGHGDVVEGDVVDDEGASRWGLRCTVEGGGDADLCVIDGGIEESDRSDGLIGSAACSHVDGSGAVVEGQGFVGPSPVPDLSNSSDTVIERKSSHCKLLIADCETIETTVEGQVVHKAARSILDEDGLVLRSRSVTHLKDAVLDGCCLGSGPVDGEG